MNGHVAPLIGTGAALGATGVAKPLALGGLIGVGTGAGWLAHAASPRAAPQANTRDNGVRQKGFTGVCTRSVYDGDMRIKVIGVEHDSGAKLVRMLTSDHEVGVILCANPLFDLAGQQPIKMSPDQWLGAGATSCVTIHLSDQYAIGQALADTDALVITLGRPSTDAAPYVGAMASVIAAAQGRVQRLVLLSDLGANNPGANEWLQALARVEGMLASTSIDTTVLRCALTVDDSDPLTRLIAAGQVRDLGGVHHPITSGDVAGACWMALHDTIQPGRSQIIGLASENPVATSQLHTVLPPTTQPGPGVNLPPSVADWFSRNHTPPPGAVIVH